MKCCSVACQNRDRRAKVGLDFSLKSTLHCFVKALPLLSLLCFCGCSSNNNLFLGEVRATVGSHPVTVTDCYRFKVDAPRMTGDGSYEFIPCRDAYVTIVNEVLTVNGKAHGRLNPGDRVLVDHGAVSTRRVG
jgi:hypothetical protein